MKIANRRLAIIMLAVLSALPAFARYRDIPQDSIRKSFFFAPALSYAKETNWRFGIVGGYFLPSTDLKHVSNIQGQVWYTLNKQVLVKVHPVIYLDREKKWFMDSELSYRYYPDIYFGHGNMDNQVAYAYLRHAGEIKAAPEYEVLPNLSVGADLNLLYADCKVGKQDSGAVMRDSLQGVYGEYGWGRQWQTGIGGHLTYDTRDSRYWPHKGLFVKANAMYYLHGLSKHPYGLFKAEYRHYITTAREQVLTWNVFWAGAVGHVPFYAMPTLGGEDHLRGFREGQFNGQTAWGIQAEYRIPLFWRLAGCLFAGIGDTYDWHDWRTYQVKYAYGIGARLRLNRQNMHARVDIAMDSYSKRPSFYITIGEAW